MNASEPDPVEFILSINPEEIQARLNKLERESEALRVFLRSARARARARARTISTNPPTGGPPHAA